MIKNFITGVKREGIYGDTHQGHSDDPNVTVLYWPYVGSKCYVKLFGLIWVRWKKVHLRGKNH